MKAPWLLPALCALSLAQPGLNPSPRVPLHVEGNRLLDSTGQALLLRGTQMSAASAALTPTTFSQIRQRWNMNTLRLIVNVPDSLQDPTYLTRISTIVRQANQAELLVIIAATEDADPDDPAIGMPTARMVQFWQTWAAAFRDNPRVLFDPFSEPIAANIPGHQPGVHSATDWRFWRNGGVAANGRPTVGMQDLVDAIRSTGAPQVIVAMALDDSPLLQGFDDAALLHDSNVVYEICPMHPANLTNAQRDQHFGFLSSRVPLLANDWDLDLDEATPDCSTIPTTPNAAAGLVRAAMDYFDEHSISWTSSLFQPGKLIDDLEFEPTRLDSGWTCGHPASPPAGMGHVVQFHLWDTTDAEVVTVGGGSGSILVPSGGVAISYGLDMADDTGAAASAPFPTTLAGISVSLTDSAGVTRLVPLQYVSPIQLNFLIPSDTAPGSAHLTIIRPGRTGPIGKVLIDPVAPGLFTATANARGPVLGFTVQQDARVPTSECDDAGCRTVPVPLSPDTVTQLILYGTGFRNAASLDTARVTLGDIDVPIVSAGVDPEVPYLDRLVLSLGPALQGLGESDLLFYVDGKVSNAVRLRVQ